MVYGFFQFFLCYNFRAKNYHISERGQGPEDNNMVNSEVPLGCCRGNKYRLNRTAFQVQNAEGQKRTKAEITCFLL